MIFQKVQDTLSETNSDFTPEIDGWNISFTFLGWPIFRGYVSFREDKAKGYHLLGPLKNHCMSYI